MGWFSDIFSIETLAPIAAGALTGGAGYGLLAASAAGAGTGAGIAALKGDDVLAGAVGGGLGGMTGGSLNAAFNPASQLKNTVAQPGLGNAAAGTNAAAVPTGPNLTAGNTATVFSGEGAMGPGVIQANPSASGFASANQIQAGQTAYGQAPLSLGDQLAKAPVRFGGGLDTSLNTNFIGGLERYGGGGKFAGLKGGARLASTGLMGAGVAGLDQTPMTMEEDDRGKYDPNATLNLSGGKPLDLSGDSGLRLIASGGYIGKYANGGYLEGGPAEGDGMSDDIPATIDETQPAALSEGEFVIPADVVAFAGNGSSDAGARRFYEMMEQIRKDATGRSEQIREIDVEDYMPMSDGIGALA